MLIIVGATVAATGHRDCGTCHLAREGTGSSNGFRASPGTSTCVSCHVLDTGAARIRQAAAGGEFTGHESIGCLTCHAGHDNGRPFQLRSLPETGTLPAALGSVEIDETSRLCLSCHPEPGKVRGRDGRYASHPVGIPAPPEHRDAIAARGVPLADNDMIACRTCHETHRSSNRFMLRYSEAQESAFCSTCHEIGGMSASRAAALATSR